MTPFFTRTSAHICTTFCTAKTGVPNEHLWSLTVWDYFHLFSCCLQNSDKRIWSNRRKYIKIAFKVVYDYALKVIRKPKSILCCCIIILVLFSRSSKVFILAVARSSADALWKAIWVDIVQWSAVAAAAAVAAGVAWDAVVSVAGITTLQWQEHLPRSP